MKKKSFLPLLFWSSLLTSILIALARFLHPAMFSVEMVVVVIAATALTGVLLLLKNQI